MGVSLGIGLLVGLQRGRTETRLGGVRTYPLMSLFGTFCGWLSLRHGVWFLAVGLVAVLVILAVSNLLAARKEQAEHGQTTELAALLTFALGAYLPGGELPVALVGTGVLVTLLHLKDPLHRLVDQIGRRDMAGIMRLVVISLIILPVLPNRDLDPFNVLNPFNIWLMVVLIAAISLGGYIAYKALGQKVGTILGGILGGVISSTATTVSFARRIRATPDSWRLALLAIVIASAIAYLRVIVEIAIIAPAHLGELAPPILAMFLWMALISAAAFFLHRGDNESIPSPGNPADLKGAILFGAVYATVLFAVAAVKHQYGDRALYGVAVLSGLTNMDAITLSVSRMVEADRIESPQGWRLMLVASLANLVFKGLTVALLGNWRAGVRLAIYFGLGIAGGLALVWLWPEEWAWSSGGTSAVPPQPPE